MNSGVEYKLSRLEWFKTIKNGIIIIIKVHNRHESCGYDPPRMPCSLSVCVIGSHRIVAKRKWAQLRAPCAVWRWCGKMEGVGTAGHRQAYLGTFEWLLWTWTLSIERCGVKEQGHADLQLKICQVRWNSADMWSCWIPNTLFFLPTTSTPLLSATSTASRSTHFCWTQPAHRPRPLATSLGHSRTPFCRERQQRHGGNITQRTWRISCLEQRDREVARVMLHTKVRDHCK